MTDTVTATATGAPPDAAELQTIADTEVGDAGDAGAAQQGDFTPDQLKIMADDLVRQGVITREQADAELAAGGSAPRAADAVEAHLDSLIGQLAEHATRLAARHDSKKK
jgi:hypothetical protein